MKSDMNKDYIYSNAKLHYSVVSGNSDTPLVLIHGQCMCGLDYEKVIEKPRHFLKAMKMLEKML